jgi:hypothetical protein
MHLPRPLTATLFLILALSGCEDSFQSVSSHGLVQPEAGADASIRVDAARRDAGRPDASVTCDGDASPYSAPDAEADARQDVVRDAARDARADVTLDGTTNHVDAGSPSVGVFTARNDVARTGQNGLETQLTAANVNVAHFGKVLSLPVDGYVYAQPLYASALLLGDGLLHDVVFAATEHDSVYAFDARTGGSPLWQVSLLDSAGTSIPAIETPDPYDIQPEIGITGTPVIDPATGTLYAVAATREPGPVYIQRLHAIDIRTGAERPGSPVDITASIVNASHATIAFDPLQHLQRPALLLVNGNVYVAFGSHGDIEPYHGWLMAYDAQSLGLVATYCSTPDAQEGSFWQSGDGIAADSDGNLYGETANGDFDGVTSFGDSALKLSATLAVLDWFSPFDQANQSAHDLDFGSSGPLLLPDQPGPHPHVVIMSGKPGLLYLLDRDGLGHTQPTDDSQIVQSVPVSPNTSLFGQELGIFTAPAYWNGNLYVAPVRGALLQYSVSAGQISPIADAQSSRTFTFPPPHVSISANGNAGGVAWVIEGDGSYPMNPAVLRAYDATDVSVELYGSDQAANGRDTAGAAVKFTSATVANGHVFVPTQTEISVYGLLP